VGARPDPGGRGERPQPRAGEPTEAERRVKRRENRAPERSLESEALRVGRHVDGAEGSAEDEQRGGDSGEAPWQRDEEERRASADQCGEHDGPASNVLDQPTGCGHRD